MHIVGVRGVAAVGGGPGQCTPFTKGELIEFLDQVDDETPLWIDNYWQLLRQITQRPIDLIAVSTDGVHFG